jgi:Flp pilus assembly protein TadD
MRSLAFLCILSLTLGLAVAQQPAPPTPPTPGGGGAPAPNVPSRETQPPVVRDRQPPFEQGADRQQRQFEQRPIFMSGKVVLNDGTPPPESVTIETVCNGVVRPQAYTDSRGRFSFQLGQNTSMMIDASVSSSAGPGPGRDPLGTGGGGLSGMGNFPSGSTGGGMGMVDLMGCELRASLGGFRSEAVILSRRSMFDNPDVGTIILHRLANVPGSAISFTTLAAPKQAKQSYEKAQKMLREKNPKPAEAAKELEKAVQIYPQFAAAWNLLGDTRLALKDAEGARKAFEQSVAADGKYINPYFQLAVLELRASNWNSAANLTNQLAQLNPQMGQAHYFNAIANFNLGKMDLAEKSVRSAMKTDETGRLPQTHHLLGAILARQGNFPSAAEEFRSYLKVAPNTSTAEQLRKQLAEWEGLGVIERTPAAPKTDKEKE